MKDKLQGIKEKALEQIKLTDSLDKLNEIKIWTDEDMSELKIIDKNKEKIDNTLV